VLTSFNTVVVVAGYDVAVVTVAVVAVVGAFVVSIEHTNA
jgi:hypothetical protein